MSKKVLRYFVALIIYSFPFGEGREGVAQELNCTVQVLLQLQKDSPQQESSADKKIMQTLQQSVFEFMNNRKWTNDVFQQDERIESSVVITVTKKNSADEFQGTIQTQARRPVYKSSYNSLILNILDKNFSFKYVEYQPMEFSENLFMSNLTSVLAYYAYVIIGTDYDTFSMEGGSPYYQKAQTVVSNSQTGNDKGWKSFEDNQNRYWIVENIQNSTFKPMRECNYKYHRFGFDAMAEDLFLGRSAVLQSLLLLKKVHESKPSSYSMQLFFLAKADEIVNLFSRADPAEKTKVMELVNEIDPANTTKYIKIMESQNE
ncbi:MAG: DUF4835 family protein [Bacteroidetes bacterium]|nr:MAG: DUF4835 family protein [Bacteroidota bacterium]